MIECDGCLQKSALQRLQLGGAPSRPDNNGHQRSQEYLPILDIWLKPQFLAPTGALYMDTTFLDFFVHWNDNRN